ncbi:MAG: DUF1460 domain-containing protein [Bacteroidales bacterium]|nr:DUF1460 domain-containing protein [Bacteroidales bacterium]
MRYIIKILFLTAIGLVTAFSQSHGQTNHDLPGISFHNIAEDTVRINQLLELGIESDGKSPEDYVALIAQEFMDTPYVAHTLEGDEEVLGVNLDELDCTTFIETVGAFAKTIKEGRGSWHDYIANLESIRYRRGNMDGYVSRLHYVCDWINDNSYRGNVKDVTSSFPTCGYVVKSIDFMTSNCNRYPQLADSAVYAGIREIEGGYSNTRFPILKTSKLNRKDVKKLFKSGYLVAFTCSLRNLDVTHWGIIIVDKAGEPQVLHASSSAGKVVMTTSGLYEFVRRNGFTGVRVVTFL